MQVDEHYFSTLLAMQRRDLETDCKGGLVGCTWSTGCRASLALPQSPSLQYPPPLSADTIEHILQVTSDWTKKGRHSGQNGRTMLARTFGCT